MYADVDLDTREVVKVMEDAESVRLDDDAVAWPRQSETERSLAVVERAFGPDAKPYEVTITSDLADRAIRIAAGTVWPEWERP